MKTAMVAAVCLALIAGMAGQENKGKAHSAQEASVVESKIRQVWADFKSKNKPGVAAVLADGFRELEEDGSGFGDSKAELAMVDAFELTAYQLTDFAVKPLAPDVALVNYKAHYEGKADGQPISSNTAYGEVWVRQHEAWKLIYVQETNVK